VDPAVVERTRVRAVSLTPSRPVETAAGVLTVTPLVLIDLTTSDGVVGRSYLRCYTPAALPGLARLVADLAELLVRTPAAPALADALLRRELRLLGTRGLTGMAMAGLDLALWDAHARARGVPLATLLGGAPRPIPAYASLRTMAPASAAEEASALAAAGFRAVKVKLGRSDLAADLAVVRALRQAVGDAVQLMVDYNQSLTVAEAVQRAAVLDGEGIAWIEEPTTAEDLTGHARVSAAARTPVQLGENWLGPADAAAAMAAGASDYATFDAMKLGGVTGWLQAAAIASRHGMPVSSHTFGEVSAHLLALTPTAHWLEYLDHVGELLTEPLQVRDGHTVPSTAPGTGLTWDEPAITRATPR
jgi:mandelate racemase